VLRQLDFAHAAGANCLAQRPCSRTRGGDGGPPLRRGRLHLAGPAVGYSIDGHGRGSRRVRSIPCVAAPARFGAGRRRGGAVLGFAAADVVVCDVALLPVVGGDVVKALLMAGGAGVAGAGDGALRAMGAVRRAGLRVRAAGRGVSHHRRRRWRCRGHDAVDVGAGCSGGSAVRTGALGVSSGRRCDQIAVDPAARRLCGSERGYRCAGEGACRGPAAGWSCDLGRRDEMRARWRSVSGLAYRTCDAIEPHAQGHNAVLARPSGR
jgi:hypothetical protein